MREGKRIQKTFQHLCQREQMSNRLISLNENQILEEVNSVFFTQIIQELSDLLNSDVKLSAHHMTIGFDYESKNVIKPFMPCNILEILPCKNPFYVIFSSNMLFVMIDILFGGKSKYSNCIEHKSEITVTEYFMNQKLIKLLMKSYSYSWKKFFLIHMKFISVKKDVSMMQKHFNLNTILITHHLILYINNVEVYFYLFSPISLLDMLKQKKNISCQGDTNVDTTVIQKLSIEHVHNISLVMEAKYELLSMMYSEISQLSVGDVISIEHPEKVVLSIDKKPVFIGSYNIFDGRSAILIQELIIDNVNEDHTQKEDFNE